MDCTPQQGADTPSSPSSAAAGAHEGGIDDHTDAYQNQDRLCAEVLQLLSRADSWDSVTSQVDRNGTESPSGGARLLPSGLDMLSPCAVYDYCRRCVPGGTGTPALTVHL